MQLDLLVFVLNLFSSVQSFSRVHFFAHHGLQHARLPYLSPTPSSCSSSCPLTWWCHPTISSSVFPFSSCLQSFLISGFFPMSQFFPSGGQIIGASTSSSVLPVNIQMDFLYDGLVWSPCNRHLSLCQCICLSHILWQIVKWGFMLFLYSEVSVKRHVYLVQNAVYGTSTIVFSFLAAQ